MFTSALHTYTGVGMELRLALFCMANDFSYKIIVGLKIGTFDTHLNRELDSSRSCIYIETDLWKFQRLMLSFPAFRTLPTELHWEAHLPKAGF